MLSLRFDLCLLFSLHSLQFLIDVKFDFFLCSTYFTDMFIPYANTYKEKVRYMLTYAFEHFHCVSEYPSQIEPSSSLLLFLNEWMALQLKIVLFSCSLYKVTYIIGIPKHAMQLRPPA